MIHNKKIVCGHKALSYEIAQVDLQQISSVSKPKKEQLIKLVTRYSNRLNLTNNQLLKNKWERGRNTNNLLDPVLY